MDKTITISVGRDTLDDLLARLRDDFVAGRIPRVVAEGETGTLTIEFLEVPEAAHDLEFELQEGE